MKPYRTDWKKIVFIGLYMSVLSFLSLVPMDADAEHFRVLVNVDPGIQNLMHIPAYGLLAILWTEVLSRGGRRSAGRYALVFLVCAVFGLANELVQVWVPGRYPSLTDGVLNVFGIFVGILFYLGIEKRCPGKIRLLVCP